MNPFTWMQYMRIQAETQATVTGEPEFIRPLSSQEKAHYALLNQKYEDHENAVLKFSYNLEKLDLTAYRTMYDVPQETRQLHRDFVYTKNIHSCHQLSFWTNIISQHHDYAYIRISADGQNLEGWKLGITKSNLEEVTAPSHDEIASLSKLFG